MDRKPSTLSGTKIAGSSNGASDPAKLRAEIAETRNEMSGTIEQLHGRLNPVVLKEQALEQFHEATETIKKELKERLQDAKQALMAELKDVKETVRVDVLEEIDTVKSRLNEEVVEAKAAVREATIGKVENMMHGAQDRVRVAGRSVKEVVADNPIPAALAGVGLAWLFVEGRRRRGEAARPERLRIPETVAVEGGQRANEDKSIGRRIRDVGQQTGQKVADATHEAVSAVSTPRKGQRNRCRISRIGAQSDNPEARSERLSRSWRTSTASPEAQQRPVSRQPDRGRRGAARSWHDRWSRHAPDEQRRRMARWYAR